MKKHTLMHTNIIVCAIITAGFIATSVIGYRSNTTIFEKDAEHVSTLAADGIYYRINKTLSEPISVSATMANDNLLKSVLYDEEYHLDDEDYTQQLADYLYAYKEKYSYDSVFLVSTQTNRYYHFGGIDRVLTPYSSENIWYYDLLRNDDDYSLNIDNDEASNDSITVFINYKIKDKDGAILGIIGVGLEIDSLQALLSEYDKEFNVVISLIDDQGVIQLSSKTTGYEHINLFENSSLVDFKDVLTSKQNDQRAFWCTSEKSKSYIVSQYVSNLKWHLILENDMTQLNNQLNIQLYKGIGIIIFIIMFVLFTITNVLKQYKSKIIKLSVSQKLEYQKLLSEATADLYDNVFEIDISNNRAAGEDLERFLDGLGIDKNTPYDKALQMIAERQIKEEYIQGYLDTFSPKSVMKCYNSGINNLSYDFMIYDDDGNYHWIRTVGRIFYWSTDESVRMISYRKNIDAEKKRELLLLEKSQRDSLTGLYNKGATEDYISSLLIDGSKHAMLIFDLDNFKDVNDKYGHAFGDFIITEFAAELKLQFRDSDIVGRIGGDEFAVLMVNYDGNAAMLGEKLERFISKIRQKNFDKQKDANISCSIGVALYPQDGSAYSMLFEKADQALYCAKAYGKSSFHITGTSLGENTISHIDSRDIKNLLDNTTDGIAKFAYSTPLKLLYFNKKLADLIGGSIKNLSSPDLNISDYIHPEDLAMILETIKTAMHEKTPIIATFRMRHKDGHYFKVKINGMFVNEFYMERYPVFYAVYTDLSDFIQ
ncbi:MAG: diguanylate cyclase [Clostridia bacterium]